jgi:hypothetical protein
LSNPRRIPADAAATKFTHARPMWSFTPAGALERRKPARTRLTT